MSGDRPPAHVIALFLSCSRSLLPMCDLRKLGDLSGPECHWGMLAQFLPHSFSLMVKEASQAEPTVQLSQGERPTPLSPQVGGQCRPVRKGVRPPPAPELLSWCPCVVPSLCDLGQLCLSLCPSPHRRTGAGGSAVHVCSVSRVTSEAGWLASFPEAWLMPTE